MIDLHTHTTYSDGTDSVKELLKKAALANIEVISITDHDTCNSYEEMKNFDTKKLFPGKIIIGCEFTCNFNNRIIEVLGYGFDYNKVSQYLKSYYTKELKEKKRTTIRKNLITKIESLKLICDKEKIKNANGNKDIYKELSKYIENQEILKEDIWQSFSHFVRKGLYNSNSKLFLNYKDFCPPIDKIVQIIHQAGGIAILAHPFQYRFDDTEIFLNKIFNENNLDGVECFYTNFTDEQSKYLLNFAKEKSLLISGGSDYHGNNKVNFELGIGKGNLNINKDILSNWNISDIK